MRNQTIICPACEWKQAYYHTRCERCGDPLPGAEEEEVVSPRSEVEPSQLEPSSPEPSNSVVVYEEEPSGWRAVLKAYLLNVEERVEMVEFIGRCVLLLVLVVMGVSALGMDMETGELAVSKMHLIHLVFHEAGHIIFSLFGAFMATAGGAIMQLLMPAIILGVFVIKYRNSFGGAVALWWIGHSCLDIAPYANDARSQKLMLLGGVTGRDVPGYHDWNNMLRKLHWLERDQSIANFFWNSGALLLVVAILWGAYLLYVQYPNIERSRF